MTPLEETSYIAVTFPVNSNSKRICFNSYPKTSQSRAHHPFCDCPIQLLVCARKNMATKKQVLAALKNFGELAPFTREYLIELGLDSITKESKVPAIAALVADLDGLTQRLAQDPYVQKELARQKKNQTHETDLVRYVLRHAPIEVLMEDPAWPLMLKLMEEVTGFIWPRPPFDDREEYFWPQDVYGEELTKSPEETRKLKRKNGPAELPLAKMPKVKYTTARVVVLADDGESTDNVLVLDGYDTLEINKQAFTGKLVSGVIHLTGPGGVEIVLDRIINDVDVENPDDSDDEECKARAPYSIVADLKLPEFATSQEETPKLMDSAEPFLKSAEEKMLTLRLVVCTKNDGYATDTTYEPEQEVCIGNHFFGVKVVNGVLHLVGARGVEIALKQRINDVDAFENPLTPNDADYDADYEDLEGPYIVSYEFM